MGRGEGLGQGKGEDTATNVAAGSGVAIALTICFFCVGVPVIFVGVAFMLIYPGSSLWDAGLAMIILSALFIVGGIVMVVLICTGCFGQGKVHQQPGAVHTGGAVIVTNNMHMQPMQQYGMGQPGAYGHQQQQQAGYSMAQPPAYSQEAPPAYKQEQGANSIPGQTTDPGQTLYPPRQSQETTAAPY